MLREAQTPAALETLPVDNKNTCYDSTEPLLNFVKKCIYRQKNQIKAACRTDLPKTLVSMIAADTAALKEAGAIRDAVRVLRAVHGWEL